MVLTLTATACEFRRTGAVGPDQPGTGLSKVVMLTLRSFDIPVVTASGPPDGAVGVP